MTQVSVNSHNAEQVLKVLKKKMQREGKFKEMKRRRHYKKPSEQKKEAKEESIRRSRKLERKRNSEM